MKYNEKKIHTSLNYIFKNEKNHLIPYKKTL